jgi:hypothetical protein
VSNVARNKVHLPSAHLGSIELSLRT